MQQGLLQFVQCGDLLLVNGFETLGFGGEGIEAGDDEVLHFDIWNRYGSEFYIS